MIGMKWWVEKREEIEGDYILNEILGIEIIKVADLLYKIIAKTCINTGLGRY